MTKLSLTKDINGTNTFGINPSTNNMSALLTQDSAQNFTVPTDYKFYQLNFAIDPGLRVWISFDGEDAEVPSGAFAETNSQMNPTSITVAGGTTVSCITPDTVALVGVAMYGLQ